MIIRDAYKNYIINSNNVDYFWLAECFLNKTYEIYCQVGGETIPLVRFLKTQEKEARDTFEEFLKTLMSEQELFEFEVPKMTFKDLLENEHPECINEDGICEGCPSNYKYESYRDCKQDCEVLDVSLCIECWNREVEV